MSKLEIAIKALEFYANNDVYVYPDNWSCFKEGGLPSIDDYDECSQMARNALSAIREIGEDPFIAVAVATGLARPHSGDPTEYGLPCSVEKCRCGRDAEVRDIAAELLQWSR